MSLTLEQRQQLLEGDEKRDARQLPKMGYGDATTAPKWAQDIIIAVREAALSHGEFRMTPQQIADREQRALATRTFIHNKLFPTTKHTQNEDAALRSRAQRQALELHNDLKLLSRARLDAEARREAEELARQVAEENARIFPWM
jgi:hypothetical protein